MTSDLLEFNLSSDEQVVCSLECTKRQRLLRSPIIGRLTVTNKRLIYDSKSTSLSGTSTIVSEIPIEDVSGISAGISVSINWFQFAIFCGLLYAITAIFASFLFTSVTGWVIAILLLLPYPIALLFDRNILSPEVQMQFVRNLRELPGSSLLMKKDRSYYLNLFRGAFLIGLSLAAWLIAIRLTYFGIPFLNTIVLLGSYYLIYRALFGRMQTFSLMVSSRSASGKGIVIPGNFLGTFFGGDSAAVQSLYSGPGKDAALIVATLGAIVTDIRQLGDLGAKKWRELPRD